MSKLNAIVFSNDDVFVKHLERGLFLDTRDSLQNLAVEFSPNSSSLSVGGTVDLVVYDFDLVGGNRERATSEIMQLLKVHGKKPVILVGSEDQLDKVVSFSELMGLISATRPKSTLATHLLLEMLEVGATRSLATQIQSIYSMLNNHITVVMLIGFIAAFFFLFMFKSESDGLSETEATVSENKVIASDYVIEAKNQESQNKNVDSPNRSGKSQYQQEVDWPNSDFQAALEHYNRLLEADPDHVDAYQRKRNLLLKLRSSFPEMLKNKKFRAAKEVVLILNNEEPFSTQNSALEELLRSATANGSAKKAGESIGRSEKSSTGIDTTSASSVDLLRQEQIASEIALAIAEGRLVEPSGDNASYLLSSAIKSSSVDAATAEKFREEILQDLQIMFIDNLGASKQALAVKTLKHMRRIDPNYKQLNQLEKLAATAGEEQDRKRQNEAVLVQDSNAATDIAPVYVLKKETPKFPSRAAAMDIEGWVELSYQVSVEGAAVNIEVMDAEPKGVFEKSGIKALKAWSFAPARIKLTGEPILSEIQTARFQFSVSD